jgi:hypothetical protein
MKAQRLCTTIVDGDTPFTAIATPLIKPPPEMGTTTISA